MAHKLWTMNATVAFTCNGHSDGNANGQSNCNGQSNGNGTGQRNSNGNGNGNADVTAMSRLVTACLIG